MYRLAVTLFLAALATSCFGQPLPLTNADFEDGLKGWSTWVAKAPTKADTAPGEPGHGQALRLLGEVNSRVVVGQSVAVQPQCWYRISYRYYAEPSGGAGGCLGYSRLTYYDGNDRFLDYAGSRPLLDTLGRWTTQQMTVKTTLAVSRLNVEFNQTGAADVRVDDVVVEPVSPPAVPANTWAQLTTKRPQPLWFSAWQYNDSAEQFRQYGLKYGWEYIFADQFTECHQNRAIGMWRGAEPLEQMRAAHVPAIVYVYFGAEQYRKDHYNGAVPEDIPYMLDPVWHDGYVAACAQACRELGRDPGLAYIFVQDESFGRWTRGPIPVAERHSQPFWRDLDATIRTRYGNGVYGLPDGPDDPNPYRWIAYLNWANDQWTQTFRRLHEVIKASGCGAKLLGPDEIGCLQPLPWCNLGQYADVFTGQSLYSRGSAQEYSASWTTRYMHDLTGKPVHNATQIGKYSGSPAPEEVQRQYSEVLQNGGEGEMLIAVEWFDRELSHHKYCAPERWATIKNLLQLMANYQVTTPKQAPVGILFSSPSAQARGPQQDNGPYLPLHTIIGPKLQAWPKVVDSYALFQGKSTLAEHRLIIAPRIPYERASVVAQLSDYVRRGGTIIFTDSQALLSDIHAGKLPGQEILGVTTEALSPQRTFTMSWPRAQQLRSYATECYRLKPTSAATRVIGTWPDGSAAATLHEFGRGRVIVLGSNSLLNAYIPEDEGWQAWWRQVLTAYKVPQNLPIWRLRLPDTALVQATAPADVCLTGNNFIRCQNGVYLRANDPQEGTYTCQPMPDLSPERATGALAFSAGNLTNRVQATKGPFDASGMAKEPYREADWADRWSAAQMQRGLFIEFNLPEARDLTRVRFWYSGTLPSGTVEGKEAGGQWRPLATITETVVGADVKEITIPLQSRCNSVRLNLGPGAGELVIADIEVWGQPQR